MITEICQYVDSLSEEDLQLGQKPKNGLHLLLAYREQRLQLEGYIRWDKGMVQGGQQEWYSRISYNFGNGWCISMNKCLDLPQKRIHSASPFFIAFKRKVWNTKLVSIADFNETIPCDGLDLEGQQEMFKGYFKQVDTFISDIVMTGPQKEAYEAFKKLETFQQLVPFLVQCGEIHPELKQDDYITVSLAVPEELVEATYARYLQQRLFNSNAYNVSYKDELYGTSGFLCSYDSKKFSKLHNSAWLEIAGRITAKQAFQLHRFLRFMDNNYQQLPQPFPLFIYEKELNEEVIHVIKEDGEKCGYQELLRQLVEKKKSDLHNYYLFSYGKDGNGNIIGYDFDFVANGRFYLSEEREEWRIKNHFDCKYGDYPVCLKSVFDLEKKLLPLLFFNAVVTKGKDYMGYHYFGDVASSLSGDLKPMVLAFRYPFFNYIYKGQREGVTDHTMKKILTTGLLHLLHTDETDKQYSKNEGTIRRLLNVWFSLIEKFSLKIIDNTMENQLEELKAFTTRVIQDETVQVVADEEYCFLVGQVVRYLLSKSETADKSHKMLEPFVQKFRSKEINLALSNLFLRYKHANFTGKFEHVIARVLTYENKEDLRSQLPFLLAGYFSENQLFADSKSNEINE